MSQVILVTGPARSGKSEWAETLARDTNQRVIYVATAIADPKDREWLARIEQHRLRRPSEWTTLLVPIELTTTLRKYNDTSDCLLVDSLGTWVANGLDQDTDNWEKTVQDLLDSLAQTEGTIIFVAEEVGWGVIPAYPMGRLFRDRLGELVRKVGAYSNIVYLVTGGYVLNLTTLGSPLR